MQRLLHDGGRSYSLNWLTVINSCTPRPTNEGSDRDHAVNRLKVVGILNWPKPIRLHEAVNLPEQNLSSHHGSSRRKDTIPRDIAQNPCGVARVHLAALVLNYNTGNHGSKESARFPTVLAVDAELKKRKHGCLYNLPVRVNKDLQRAPKAVTVAPHLHHKFKTTRAQSIALLLTRAPPHLLLCTLHRRVYSSS
jgi:hypothetical protein